MKRTAILAAIFGLALTSPAFAAADLKSIESTLETAIPNGAQQALGKVGPVSNSKAASVAQHRKTKRYKLPVWVAYDVTYETALYEWVYDIDAITFGAYGCGRSSAYRARCVGWISGTLYAPDYSSAQDYTCDWYQDVWVNKKNQIKTWTYQVECWYGTY